MKKALLGALLLLGGAQAQTFLYLGPVGTYSDQVAQEVARNRGWTPTLATSITEVSQQVSAGKAPYGLIPIENSSGGYVAETLTLLAKTPGWRIIGVADLPIDNMLLVNPGTKASEITTIVSHPQPFLQSASYLKAHFPNVRRIEAKSTAAAAEQVAREGGHTVAAIAAPAAAGVYHLEVLAARIQDDKANTTRFLVVQSAELEGAASADRVVISFLPAPGDDGRALSELLIRLRSLGLHVTGVASAPTGRLGGERLTLFLSGRTTTTAQLQQAVARAAGQATLIGAYLASAGATGAEAGAGAAGPVVSTALTQLCPDLNPGAGAGQRLAQLTACRLDLAYDVARAKYVSGAAIEDLEREKVVIENGVKAVPGVSDAAVRAYWSAQIDASKGAQRLLIDRWKASGTPAFTDAPDLSGVVRPKLDALGAAINEAISETWGSRTCPTPAPTLPAPTPTAPGDGGHAPGRALLGTAYTGLYQAALAPVTGLCTHP